MMSSPRLAVVTATPAVRQRRWLSPAGNRTPGHRCCGVAPWEECRMHRVEIPERDADLCRRQNLALAELLGGDTTVVNPSRVLRLGGSIAWPAKPGRVLERTEFHLFDDGRPKVYVDGQLARGFPPKPAASATPTEVAANGMEPSSAPKPDLKIGSEFDGVSVEACLAA